MTPADRQETESKPRGPGQRTSPAQPGAGSPAEVFPLHERLPGLPSGSGRHGLSREQVAENQRQRLFLAIAELCAERGFAQTTAAALVARAGVSKGAIYQHFDSIEDCLRGALRMVSERLWQVVGEACESQAGEPWPQRVAAALSAALALIESEPALALLLCDGGQGTGREWARLRQRALDRFAGLLVQGREHFPAAADLPEATEQALLGGVASTVSACIWAGEPQRLLGLAPALTEFVLGPLHGAAVNGCRLLPAAAIRPPRRGPRFPPQRRPLRRLL